MARRLCGPAGANGEPCTRRSTLSWEPQAANADYGISRSARNLANKSKNESSVV
ncbi:hypothetical protein GCM10022212_13120 [Actimicrobium antarcticum]|uniref:Uncharacterized protein n=1 Tax=Actimicrobium antarcticum TaxID=1051899 RepID=A0ABP7SZA8_9BURK